MRSPKVFGRYPKAEQLIHGPHMISAFGQRRGGLTIRDLISTKVRIGGPDSGRNPLPTGKTTKAWRPVVPIFKAQLRVLARKTIQPAATIMAVAGVNFHEVVYP